MVLSVPFLGMVDSSLLSLLRGFARSVLVLIVLSRTCLEPELLMLGPAHVEAPLFLKAMMCVKLDVLILGHLILDSLPALQGMFHPDASSPVPGFCGTKPLLAAHGIARIGFFLPIASSGFPEPLFILKGIFCIKTLLFVLFDLHFGFFSVPRVVT